MTARHSPLFTLGSGQSGLGIYTSGRDAARHLLEEHGIGDQILETVKQALKEQGALLHWVRDVPLREDAHRYRENNDVQFQAKLRSLAINALRLDEIWSINEGIAAALAHDIKGLLSLLGWRPAALPPPVQLLIGPACVPGSSRCPCRSQARQHVF